MAVQHQRHHVQNVMLLSSGMSRDNFVFMPCEIAFAAQLIDNYCLVFLCSRLFPSRYTTIISTTCLPFRHKLNFLLNKLVHETIISLLYVDRLGKSGNRKREGNFKTKAEINTAESVSDYYCIRCRSVITFMHNYSYHNRFV